MISWMGPIHRSGWDAGCTPYMHCFDGSWPRCLSDVIGRARHTCRRSAGPPCVRSQDACSWTQVHYTYKHIHTNIYIQSPSSPSLPPSPPSPLPPSCALLLVCASAYLLFFCWGRIKSSFGRSGFGSSLTHNRLNDRQISKSSSSSAWKIWSLSIYTYICICI